MEPRKISFEEMADLPSSGFSEHGGWHNFTEDPYQYWVSFMEAWEIDEETFEDVKAEGVLSIEYKSKYYMAR